MTWRRFLIIIIVIVPIVWLLAYGFSRDPRYIVSPLMGRQAPEFTLTLFDGNTASLSNFRGRVACLPPRYTVSAGGR